MRGCLSHSSIYAMPTCFCVPQSNNREENQNAGGSREIKVLSEEPFHIFLSEQNLANCCCHFVMKKPELDLVHMDFLPTLNPPYIFKGVVS